MLPSQHAPWLPGRHPSSNSCYLRTTHTQSCTGCVLLCVSCSGLTGVGAAQHCPLPVAPCSYCAELKFHQFYHFLFLNHHHMHFLPAPGATLLFYSTVELILGRLFISPQCTVTLAGGLHLTSKRPDLWRGAAVSRLKETQGLFFLILLLKRATETPAGRSCTSRLLLGDAVLLERPLEERKQKSGSASGSTQSGEGGGAERSVDVARE